MHAPSLLAAVRQRPAAGTERSEQVARLPWVVRSAADVMVLRDHPNAVRKLPEAGLKVAIPGLPADAAQYFNLALSRYVGACGCAEGAVLALGALLVWALYFVGQLFTRGLQWRDLPIAGLSLLLCIAVAGLGKALGLQMARLRFQRECDRVLRHIAVAGEC